MKLLGCIVYGPEGFVIYISQEARRFEDVFIIGNNNKLKAPAERMDILLRRFGA